MDQTADGMARTDKDAASLLGISQSEFARLKKQDGFPPKEDNLWNATTIVEWMATRQSDDEDDDTAAADNDSDEAVETSAGDDDDRVRYVQIMIPVAHPFGNIAAERFSKSVFRSHIDCVVNVETQLVGLRHSHAGMRDSHAQFPDGEHVDTRAEAIRYLMQLIGEEVNAERFVAPPE